MIRFIIDFLCYCVGVGICLFLGLVLIEDGFILGIVYVCMVLLIFVCVVVLGGVFCFVCEVCKLCFVGLV